MVVTDTIFHPIKKLTSEVLTNCQNVFRTGLGSLTNHVAYILNHQMLEASTDMIKPLRKPVKRQINEQKPVQNGCWSLGRVVVFIVKDSPFDRLVFVQ